MSSTVVTTMWSADWASALQKQAAADGVGVDEIEAAVDSDEPKAELVALIIEHRKAADSADDKRAAADAPSRKAYAL